MNFAPDTSVLDVIVHNSRAHPGGIAIVSNDASYTNRELADAVARVAAGFRNLGIDSGSRVGLICSNRVEWAVAFYGALAAGATVTAFNTWSKRWDLDQMLEHSRCDILVAVDHLGDTDLRPLLAEVVPEAWSSTSTGWQSASYPQLRDLILIAVDVPPGARSFDDLLNFPTNPDLDDFPATVLDLPLAEVVLYTSGSTASPKAVRLTQTALVQHALAVGERMGIEPADRVWVPVPLFWSYGGANALMVGLVHACPIILQERFDARESLTLIERERCTVAYLLPNIAQRLTDCQDFSPAKVATLTRGMIIGPPSAIVHAALTLGVTHVCNAYGSTEMYGGATTTPHDWTLEHRANSQGLPLRGTLVRILDSQTGARIGEREVGEIVVSGSVSPGYLEPADHSTSPFTSDGAFHTGDLGYIENGEVHYVGRASEMIRSGGINISPLEVEEFLLTNDCIEDVVVVGAEADSGDQVAIAFVRVAQLSVTDEVQLTTYCRERIASYKVPRRFVLRTSDFPRTSTGKLARAILRDEGQKVWSSWDNGTHSSSTKITEETP
ncbi:class I adenylate-forming enzyme family protein [Cryobacterium sp. M15]|uniref:class I adenylate-forming enzyme family protein n=1 Tax=Cryobacterium sp. M15 TaxID=2048291 RepID=UPI001304A525|nr:class I adenylate-forming enzyme family protein [Cryobacterium sp. M15]